jgi:hypothetical protein
VNLTETVKKPPRRKSDPDGGSEMSVLTPGTDRRRAGQRRPGSLAERRRSTPYRRAREALDGGIDVAMVALCGDPRLAVRAAKILIEDRSAGLEHDPASAAGADDGDDRASLEGRSN